MGFDRIYDTSIGTILLSKKAQTLRGNGPKSVGLRGSYGRTNHATLASVFFLEKTWPPEGAMIWCAAWSWGALPFPGKDGCHGDGLVGS